MESVSEVAPGRARRPSAFRLAQQTLWMVSVESARAPARLGQPPRPPEGHVGTGTGPPLDCAAAALLDREESAPSPSACLRAKMVLILTRKNERDTMGCMASKPDYIESAAGGEKEYLTNYVEGKTLGQGEFGVVKLVTDVREKDSANAKPKACKYLKKGYVFKDNTLYAPVKRSVLEGEVDILRRLDGKCYCLRLCDVYESPSQIYMITGEGFSSGSEFASCQQSNLEEQLSKLSRILRGWGDDVSILPWVSKAFQDTSGLRTEDVSRISYELWSAVDHCAKNKVLHRDIKPENIMFVDSNRSSQLRLIDFGSGRCDELEQAPGNEVDRYTTFAGSAFYISPEMFQHSYTNKTDVWSAGAALYVLVAGYPADQLQLVFDKLQSTKPNRLKSLPNMPSNMPESFYEMLEGALQYRHKSRSEAGALMKGEFSQFHIELSKEAGSGGAISIHEVAQEAAEQGDTVPEMSTSKSRRTTSVVLEGSVKRHNAYLGYQKFERSLTTMQMNQKKSASMGSDISDEKKEEAPEVEKGNAAKLQVVTIKELMSVLTSMEMVDERERVDVIKMIQGLRGFMFYETFAYHVAALRQLINEKENQKERRKAGLVKGDMLNMSVHGSRVFANAKKQDGSRSGKGNKFFSADLDGSQPGAAPDTAILPAQLVDDE
ncbi:hypothetical protein THAOC_37677 [Thalassiosira oceanica]|uniref:Protein kinase domain-containing protein n=1 Tax=Thalassiosira oceanica TaxID=159749 RepID=K0QYI8_THAOC|nr:hypothetical protein THAOC_37677 [Thalassiosira oceanica]|eukprot:EJK43840.1 hypothetical protein THAOC_37677 [Thalassiosira oceanica]